MKNIQNNLKENNRENISSSISEEINSLNKNTTSRKFLNYFIPIAFFGYLFYQITLPKLLGNELFSKFSIILLFATIIICIIVFCSLYFKAKFISETAYEIFDISKNYSEGVVYFSYLNSDKKLKKCKLYSGDLLRKLYLTDKSEDKSYVTVENYGHSGKITKEVVTKFFCSMEQYKDFSITFSWNKHLV